MKHLRYLALLSIFAMLSSLSVFARNKNQQSVDIPDTVQVGGHAIEARQLQNGMARNRARRTGDLPAGWEDCSDGPGDA